MKLEFLNLTKTKIDPRIFDPVLRASKKYLNTAGRTLSLVIVGEDRMRKLNRFSLKKDRPTDVLAFAIDEQGILGEVFICPSMARGYESKQKALQFLLIHGILHILGFTHKSEKDYARMRDLENKLFRHCS